MYLEKLPDRNSYFLLGMVCQLLHFWSSNWINLQEPELFTISPAKAIPKSIKSAGLEASQIYYYEINEAFAVRILT